MGRPRRPDADPVSVTADHRVNYYPSGWVDGNRKTHRCRSAAEAEAWARIKRGDLLALRGVGLEGPVPGPHRSVSDAIEAFNVHMLDLVDRDEMPEGTRLKYIGVLRTWVEGTIGHNTGAELCNEAFQLILDSAKDAGKLPNTINGITTAIGTFTRWGVEEHWFPPSPFGSDDEKRAARRSVANKQERKNAVKRAQAVGVTEDGDDDRGITIDMVMSWGQVKALASAVERRAMMRKGGPDAPNRGGAQPLGAGAARQLGRSVTTKAASGIRECELLGLHTEVFDRSKGTLDIVRQLDRYTPWEPGTRPPLQPPKFGRARVAQVWLFYLPTLIEIADWADEHTDGWMFAPTRDQKYWPAAWETAISAGVDLLNSEQPAKPWTWDRHWLRHHYGSVSITPERAGGMGWTIDVLQQCMGHKSRRTTEDTYITTIATADEHARQASLREPE